MFLVHLRTALNVMMGLFASNALTIGSPLNLPSLLFAFPVNQMSTHKTTFVEIVDLSA